LKDAILIDHLKFDLVALKGILHEADVLVSNSRTRCLYNVTIPPSILSAMGANNMVVIGDAFRPTEPFMTSAAVDGDVD